MNSWSQAIIEWANCLGIVESSVESIQDLQDGVFYETLVSQLCRGNDDSFINDTKSPWTNERISKFITAEYPKFECIDSLELSHSHKDLYIASLLLVQCAQQPMFHRPMCVALKQETQVRIKQFLEMVLPYGKNLTKESIDAWIKEVEDDAVPSETHLTPKVRPLREFFNSPAVKSARSQRFMNERNRELMSLRAQLETEQYEKADLIEDLKIQSEKVCNLQKKLDEQTRELRDLRSNRLKPPTPKSCRKSKKSLGKNEERYQRQAEELETMNKELALELEKLREEKEELARRLISRENFAETMKEKYEQSEKTLESLAHDLETRNNEILYLRTNTEELREHIRQTKRLSFGDQSFDAEPTCSEALSSIVDLQLQEARQESAQLKNELSEVRLELENSLRECEKLRGLEIIIREKTTELDSVRKSLNETEEQLSSNISRVTNLELERSQLSEKLTKLEDQLQEKIELIAFKQERNNQLESDLEIAHSRVNDLTASLDSAKSKTIELSSIVEDTRREFENVQSTLSLTKEQLSLVKEEKNHLESLLDEKQKKLQEMNISLENEKVSVKKLELLVDSCNEESQVLRKDLTLSNERLTLVNEERKILESTLRSTLEKLETTDNCLQNEKTRITELESTLLEANKNIEDMKNLLDSREECLNQERTKITEFETILNRNKKDNEELQAMLDELKVVLQSEKAESNALKEMVSRSKKTSEDLESLLLSKEELLRESKERENYLNEELEFCKSKNNEFNDSLRVEIAKSCELEIKLFERNQKYDELEANLVATKNLFEEMEIDKRNVETKLETANVKITEIELKLENVKSEVLGLEEEKRQSISANIALEERAKLEAEKIINMETKILNYEKSIQDLNRSLTEKTEKVSELQNELNEKSTSLDSLSQHLDESAKREAATVDLLRASEQKVAELHELSQEMDSQMAKEHEKSTNLYDEIKKLEEKLSISVHTIKDLENKCDKLKEEFNESQEKLHKETTLSEELKIRVEEFRRSTCELEEELSTKKNELATVLSQWDECKKELTSSINEVSLMKNNNEKMTEELEEARERFQKESLKNEEITKELEASRSINKDLEEELSTKKNELATVLSQWEECKKELTSSINEISLMKQDIEKITEELKESQENFQKESLKNEEITKELDASCSINKDLEEELSTKKNELATVLSQWDECKKELTSSINEISLMKQDFEKITEELKESQENFQKESLKNEEITKELDASCSINKDLEEELSTKKNELATVLSQWDECKKELTSSINEVSLMKQDIEKITEELKESQENFQKESLKNEEITKELEASRSINKDLEEELSTKKNELATVLSQWDECKKELTSSINEVSLMKKDIEKMTEELKESQENFQKESLKSEEVSSELEALRTMNKDFEDKWTECKIKVETVTAERNNLKEELTEFVNDKLTMTKEMKKMEKELEKYASDMQKQVDVNSTLTKKELESNALIEKLQLELTKDREQLENLESAKTFLEQESSSFAILKAEMTEKMSALHKVLESSRNDQQNLQESHDKECNKFHQQIEKLNEESKRRMEEIKSLQNQLESIKLEKVRLIEKMEETNNTVAVLEKRLVVAENTRMEIELEDKLKKEALNVVQAKLEQLGKEKIETELRMKEVIVNLQEVRTSQDQVMEAQIQALEEKSRQHINLEKEMDEFRIALRDKTSKLEAAEAKMKDVLTELKTLEEQSEAKSALVEKLESSLKLERQKVDETTKNLETLNNSMIEIDKISRVLKAELDSLWDSVRNTLPELARSKTSLDIDDDTKNLLAAFVEDAKAIQRVVSILSEANETLKEHVSSEKESARTSCEEMRKQKIELNERLQGVETELEKRHQHMSLLAQRNKNLQELLIKVASEKDKVEDELVHSINRWKLLSIEAESFITTGSSNCEEFKHLVSQRNGIENSLLALNERHICNSKSLFKSLHRIFCSSETTELQSADNVSLDKEASSPETILSEEIQRDELMKQNLADLVEKMNEFSESLKTYDTKLKSGLLDDASENERKLRAELEKISKEKKDIRDKLDTVRARNAKMEKNMDDLRNDSKKVKSELIGELEKLRASIDKLEEEKAELAKRVNEKADVETLHNEYGQKLEKIKQKMKTAYNEQIAKLNQEQEKILKEKIESLKMQTEQQCRKYAEDIAKYKAHISDLSSRYWDVGEKLLAETQEKQAALQQVQRLKELKHHQETTAELKEQVVHSRQKTASLDRREFTIDRLSRDPSSRVGYGAVEVIEEETTTFSTHRRHSVKSIQAMGNAFRAEDEEGEVFDSVYLADLKEGRCAPTGPDLDRLSELRMRNSMCRPHLKSSYAVETHLQPIVLHEDDIKNGVTGDDVFNDSLSQSLLPGQKPKKKDRTQTSYKRPGPPTPSKNGGRLSLQGNELKSPNSRILKERNVDRRTTATPRGLKNLFGTSMSKRQDENTAGTPKGRRLSNIFRKQRTERN